MSHSSAALRHAPRHLRHGAMHHYTCTWVNCRIRKSKQDATHYSAFYKIVVNHGARSESQRYWTCIPEVRAIVARRFCHSRMQFTNAGNNCNHSLVAENARKKPSPCAMQHGEKLMKCTMWNGIAATLAATACYADAVWPPCGVLRDSHSAAARNTSWYSASRTENRGGI